MIIELTERESLLIRTGLARSILAVLDTDLGPHSAVTSVVAEMTDLLVRLDG
jgi:hypothetical protein